MWLIQEKQGEKHPKNYYFKGGRGQIIPQNLLKIRKESNRDGSLGLDASKTHSLLTMTPVANTKCFYLVLLS